MIIVTLTKLFVIKMVASVRSESARSSMIFLSHSSLLSSISFRSLGESEKKAISEPDANPETTNRRHAKIAAKTAPAEGVSQETSLNNC